MSAPARPLDQAQRAQPAWIDVVGLGLTLLAAYNLGLGLWMAVSPHSFFTALGPFGPRNDHYIRDNATFSLALGGVLLAALRRRAWAAPLFAFSALQFGLHTLNHLNDIDAAHPHWIGLFDFATLAGTTVVLALLCRYALAERAITRNAEGRSSS
jgi:hypothetical protein